MGIILNITSWDEHVPEIERFIRTVKVRVWAIVNTLPFEQCPNRIIVETRGIVKVAQKLSNVELFALQN